MGIKKALRHYFKHSLKWIGRTRFVLWLIGTLAFFYTWLVGKTGRFRVYGIEDMENVFEENEGGIFVAWHGRTLMLPYFWRNTRLMKALVSPHNDGRIIARLLKYYHILSIDGSTDRRATGAAVEIFKELKEGHIVALISDGPRGPSMILNKSVIYFAKKTGKPIVGLTYSSENASILKKSWDSMLIPKLFNKGVVYATKPLFVSKDASDEELEILRKQFEDELNELTFKADRECSLPLIKAGDKHLDRGTHTHRSSRRKNNVY